MKVKKRNGDVVEYDIEKIACAVAGPFQEKGEDFEDVALLDSIDEHVRRKAKSGVVSVEEIQDVVEDELIYAGYLDEAKRYIKYRYDHELARQRQTDENIFQVINQDPDSYWAKENSNKNPKLVHIQRDYLAGVISTDIAKRYIFPKDVVEAHDDGIVHQHDMDYMAQNVLTNCELINLEDMLQNGTVINGVRVHKPHRLLTAMTIATQIMAAVGSSTYGGQSISLAHIAPFVRDSYYIYLNKYKKAGLDNDLCEKMARQDTKKEITDAVQTFNYQSSTFCCLNGQAVFSSMFIYLNENPEYKRELIALTEEFLRQRVKGMPNEDGVNTTQEFPKILYILQEDNYKPGTKYWFLTKQALNCSVRRLTPDYISEKVMKEIKINGKGEGDCFACMGCRSFLSPDPTTDGFGNISRALNYDPNKPKYWGRFNLGVSSINLPDIAFAAKGDEDKFFRILEERLHILHRGLQTRIKRISKTKAKVAPILWMYGAMARLDPEDTLYDLVHNSFSTISLGFVGLYEACQIITGENQSQPNGNRFAKRVLQYLTDTAEKWKQEENVGYSVYSSPAESLCYKFATKTREHYPEEFEKYFGNKKYFENSYHLPSFLEIDPFSKIKIEGELQHLSTGGCLSYIESCDLSNNVEALYPILEYIYNYTMYCEINIKTSYCHVCGNEQTIDVHKDDNGDTYWECAICGNRDTEQMDVSARTCGYVGSTFWNDGKTQEIASRFQHLSDHAYADEN